MAAQGDMRPVLEGPEKKREVWEVRLSFITAHTIEA
jgi:hypothetical protein